MLCWISYRNVSMYRISVLIIHTSKCIYIVSNAFFLPPLGPPVFDFTLIHTDRKVSTYRISNSKLIFFSFSVRYRVELSFNSHDTSYQVYNIICTIHQHIHTMYMLNSSCTWRVTHTAGGPAPPAGSPEDTPKTRQIDIFADYV